MNIKAKAAFILIISLIMAGCGKAEPEQAAAAEAAQPARNAQQSQTQDETAAAESKLPDAAPIKGVEWIKNGPVSMEKGKIYVIEFWATWCGPCRVSIPHLTELQKNFKDKGVTFVGISTEAPSTVKPFVKDMGDQMNYSVAVDTDGYMDRNYMKAFKKDGIPQAFLVDKKGKIVWEGHPMADLEDVLKQVVQGAFDPAAYAKQKAEEAKRQQQAMQWYMDYFQTIQTEGLTDAVKQIGEKFIEIAPADGLNSFSWNILTQVAEDNRDLQAALKAAQKANEQTEGKDPSVLDTLALALFETGEVTKAIETQQKAVDLASDYPQAQQEFKQRLQRYKDALGDAI